jgi:hypothetical protein
MRFIFKPQTASSATYFLFWPGQIPSPEDTPEQDFVHARLKDMKRAQGMVAIRNNF